MSLLLIVKKVKHDKKKVSRNNSESVNADTCGQMGILIILLYHAMWQWWHTHIHQQKSIIKRNHRKLLNKKKTNSNFSGIFSFFAFKKITMTTKF